MRKSNFKVFVLAAVFIFTGLPAAFAHKLVLWPDNFTVPQDGTVGISWSFTEVIFEPEYSRTLTEYVYPQMGAPVEVRYKSGRISRITSEFESLNWETKAKAEDPMQLDYDYARFKVEGAGTVVVEGRFSGTKNENGQFGEGSDYSHVKTFLNLTNDGTVTKNFTSAGENLLEVVFAEDVAKEGVRVGDTVEFEFYYNGVPLKNTEVFAAYDGAPKYKEIEEGQEIEVNDYLFGETDGNGTVSFTLDHSAGWFVGAFNNYESDGGVPLGHGGGVCLPFWGVTKKAVRAAAMPGRRVFGASPPPFRRFSSYRFAGQRQRLGAERARKLQQ